MNDNSDILKFTANIEKTPIIFIDEVYTRTNNWVCLYFERPFIHDCSLLTIDDKGNRVLDPNAIYLSYYAESEDVSQVGDHFTGDVSEFNFYLHSTKINEERCKSSYGHLSML